MHEGERRIERGAVTTADADSRAGDPGGERAGDVLAPAGDLAGRVGDVEATLAALDRAGYVADLGLATALFCAVRLPQPLLLEGEAGVGKTEAAKALATALETPLVRLQCYEGIDAAEALYEWN